MSSESIPVGLRSLLAKHYFLAQISQGYKPCMSNMTLVDSTSWLGSIYRSWYGESRKTVIADIGDIINQTIDAISAHRNKPGFLRLLINALASTRVGIDSMKNTYRNDPAMISSIQVQLTNIDLQLQEYRHLITGYASSSKTIDENIVNEMVETTETNDKEGFKNFLMGNSSVTQSVKDTSSKTRENSELKEIVIESPASSVSIPVPPPPIINNNNNLPPSGNIPTTKSILTEAAAERRRRHQKAKQIEDTSEKTE